MYISMTLALVTNIVFVWIDPDLFKNDDAEKEEKTEVYLGYITRYLTIFFGQVVFLNAFEAILVLKLELSQSDCQQNILSRLEVSK